MKRMLALGLCLATVLAVSAVVRADETCNSPYIAKLIKGQEDYVYVWALGMAGLGDGSDKLVTVDVYPKSKSYGKVIHAAATGAQPHLRRRAFGLAAPAGSLDTFGAIRHKL